MRDYEYIMAVDDNGQPYLAHALTKESGQVRYTSGRRGASTKGSQRQNHKYYTRVEDRGRWRYFYSPEEFRAWSTGARQSVGNKVNQATSAARGIADRIGNRASEAAGNLRSRATNAYREATGLADRDRMNASRQNLNRANENVAEAERRFYQTGSRNNANRINAIDAAENAEKARNAANAARAEANTAREEATAANERLEKSNIFNRRKNRAAAEEASEKQRQASAAERRAVREENRASETEREAQERHNASVNAMDRSEENLLNARRTRNQAEADYNSDREAYERSLAGRSEQAKNKASDAIDATRDKATDIANTARTKASNIRDTIRDKVSDAKDIASQRAENASNALRDRSERMKSDLRKLTNKAGEKIADVVGVDERERKDAAAKNYEDAVARERSTENARRSAQNERFRANNDYDPMLGYIPKDRSQMSRAERAHAEGADSNYSRAAEKANQAMKDTDDASREYGEARRAYDKTLLGRAEQVGNTIDDIKENISTAVSNKFRDAKASADDLMKGTKLYKEWRDNPSLETFSALKGNKTATAIRDARNKIMDSMDQAVLKATSGMKGAEIHEQYKKASEAYLKDPTPENAKRADDLYDEWLDSPHGRLINNDFISNAQSNGLRTAVSDAAENARDSVKSAAGKARDAVRNAAGYDEWERAQASRERLNEANQNLDEANRRYDIAERGLNTIGEAQHRVYGSYENTPESERKTYDNVSDRWSDAHREQSRAEDEAISARIENRRAEEDYDRTLLGRAENAREAVGNAASSVRDAANRAVELTQSQANRLQKKLNEGKELTQQEMNSLITFLRRGKK